MSSPIFDKLVSLNKKNIYPFCMPGHKRSGDFFPKDILSFDYTEIDGTDILRNPEGIIKEAQEKLARTVSSDYAFICVNGSTGAIQGSLLYAAAPNEKVLVAANCHKSVINAIILNGAIPVFITPSVTEYGFFAGIMPDDVKYAVDKYSDIKACILTSPTYEGIVSDIFEISKILSEKGITFIVDEAHGAYFNYFDFLPESAIAKGADIVIQSYHKTLPLPNQCAVVLADKAVDTEKLNMCLSLTETTSPSYIFMAMIDKISAMLKENSSLKKNYGEKLINLRESLSENKVFKLLNRESSFYDLDSGKLVLIINADISGKEVSDILRSHRIQAEAYGLHHIILMTSPADCKNNFECFDMLLNAVNDLENKFEYKKQENIFFKTDKLYSPKMRPRDVFYGKKESILLENSAGKISGDTVFAYPPGIPVIYCGGIISEEKIAYLNELNKKNISIIGCDMKKINVIAGYTKGEI